ncbi:hypothetical protein [Halobacillus karajensis]|uniref:Uncharacterized protein n=1 Tax=Halobacillus karajensis TaxID=195088 RepID=A0A024P6I4_9BACI|nr:hypothetical protein [Halobacillus karajensis]CDQ20569.1 hypothetical protein BN982_02917 [Halobacillus karajensis]CDQ23962.1 hypothetical protein BN983_02220 [Halobacillus karajensis]CDQ27440.1 hypothetical protein BN981_01701 [Halobacillus karajensis]
MSKEHLLRAANDFNKRSFNKLFEAFRVKYEITGEMAGNIYLFALSYEELTSIADFMDKTIYALELKGKLSILKFEEQLKVKYPGVELKQLLPVYFGDGYVQNTEKVH